MPFVLEESRVELSLLPVSLQSQDQDLKKKPRKHTSKGTSKETKEKRLTTNEEVSSPPQRRSSKAKKSTTLSVGSTVEVVDPTKRTKRSKSDLIVKSSLRCSNPERSALLKEEQDSPDGRDSRTETQDPPPSPLSVSHPEKPNVEIKREGPIVTKMEGNTSVILFGLYPALVDLALNDDYYDCMYC